MLQSPHTLPGIHRAAVLDTGQHWVHREKLCVPQSARDVFKLLSRGQWIAVHDYQGLVLSILVNIITLHLDEVQVF